MTAVVDIRDENYETTFIKEIYGDSNALSGKTDASVGTMIHFHSSENNSGIPLIVLC